MTAKYSKFAAVKLILIIFAAIAGTFTAFLLGKSMGPSADPMFSAVLGIIPSVVFFVFIYFFQSKISVPRDITLDARYFTMFSLRETSVYVIFLIPITALSYIPSVDVTAGTLLASVFRPHMPLAAFGAPHIVDAAIMAALYFALSLAAHFRSSKRPAPQIPPEDSEDCGAISDDSEENTDDDAEQNSPD